MVKREKPIPLARIRELAKSWREIASDTEAAPTGTMLRAINQLLREIELHRALLDDLRPHVDALSVTDNDPEYKTLLNRVDLLRADG